MDVVKIGKAAPDQEVVKTLEDLCEAAKNGKVRAVIIAAKLADETSAHITAGYFDHLETVGFIYRMLHKVNKLMDETTYNIGPLAEEKE